MTPPHKIRELIGIQIMEYLAEEMVKVIEDKANVKKAWTYAQACFRMYRRGEIEFWEFSDGKIRIGLHGDNRVYMPEVPS